ncbi:MAG: MFS transporter [Hyphomicrobium sp.]|nr:MFS transporter [Hyphomicrobium sp.]
MATSGAGSHMLREQNLAPSMHWPAPIALETTADLDRPVMIEITYVVPTEQRTTILDLVKELTDARSHSDAYGWSLMQDAADPARMIEIWRETSWMQHLRHHERVSVADRQLQERIKRLLEENTEPVIRHFVAPVQHGQVKS